MKKCVFFLILSGSLIAGNAYSADHRSGDRSKHSERQHSERSRHQSHHRSERSRHHTQSRSRHEGQRHSSNSRHHSNRNSHHRRSHNNNAGYFLGGLVLGSLSQGYANSHSSRHHDHSPRDCSHESHRYDYNDYSTSYWRDRRGSCYRVEYRRSGKVYVGVPHYKCR